MFSQEFYPTPPALIDKMLAHAGDLAGKYVLEPSAGKGDILDAVAERCRYENKAEAFAVEINPSLRAVLREKGHRVVASDFLSYAPSHDFDVILMNPPFSNGDEHLLKAWEILNEGKIICLLNTETVRNPFSAKRQLVERIIAEHGAVEFLGDGFANAERKTDVEVALVVIEKTSSAERFEFSGSRTNREFSLDEDCLDNQVATNDIIANLVLQFDRTREVFGRFLKVQAELRFYSDVFYRYGDVLDTLKELSYHESPKDKFNEFVKQLQRKAWETVFDKTKIRDLATERVRRDFESYQQEQGALDFTEENIWNLLQELFLNRKNVVMNSLVEIFDHMTSFDAKNKTHYEGWKTNSAHAVNRRVILPNFIKIGYDNWFRVNYCYSQQLHDIDKVMCMITGKEVARICTIEDALKKAFDRLGKIDGRFDNCTESLFFEIKFFKKGTIHLRFKDRFVWEQFNKLAALGKEWLPEGDVDGCKPTEVPLIEAGD
ncbi:MAG: DUF4942 domain-containing protein [Desulfovibrionaceae bacterium]